MNQWADLINRHPGETCYIVGKDSSLPLLGSRHFGEGIVIALNDSIVPVQEFGLQNKIYSLQKDGHPYHMIEPYAEIAVILQDTEGYSRDYFPDHPERYLVDPLVDLGFDYPQVVVVRMAIAIARKMGCRHIVMMCCGSLTGEDYQTYNPRTGLTCETAAAQWYKESKLDILDDLESISHSFFIPGGSYAKHNQPD